MGKVPMVLGRLLPHQAGVQIAHRAVAIGDVAARRSCFGGSGIDLGERGGKIRLACGRRGRRDFRAFRKPLAGFIAGPSLEDAQESR